MPTSPSAVLILGLPLALALVGPGQPTAPSQRPTPFSVAHRGASAYAPEHTLASYRLALEQGADYVEQDLGITRDGVLVCLHDVTLERTTDVEEVFPDRFTEVTERGVTTKRWFVDDFTLAEVKQLDAGSWFAPQFAGARVATFQEAIDLVKGTAGIFPELKGPGRLRDKGISMEEAVARVLRANGLVDATVAGRPAVLLQSFEEASVRSLARLLPSMPRTLLIGTPDAAARWLTPEGFGALATFATGIGPAKALIAARPAMVREAQAAGLTVVPYTFRVGAVLPGYDDVTAEMRAFLVEYGVDGLFTDNPDLFPRLR
jgi:glycerophosphoryl diester phosphodiesterase